MKKHYLKQKYYSESSVTVFMAWCGFSTPDGTEDPNDYVGTPSARFTYNISNVTCTICEEAAALDELAKIP